MNDIEISINEFEKDFDEIYTQEDNDVRIDTDIEFE
jgi:hypothetical protein